LNERNSLTSLFRLFSNAHPAVAVCDSDKVLMKARQGRKGTDQGAAKMSIDTGKKKDLGLSQTFAQWFAPGIRADLSSKNKSIPSDTNSFS
jgi:hypothetical protein